VIAVRALLSLLLMGAGASTEQAVDAVEVLLAPLSAPLARWL
jgi:hypothetical protein